MKLYGMVNTQSDRYGLRLFPIGISRKRGADRLQLLRTRIWMDGRRCLQCHLQLRHQLFTRTLSMAQTFTDCDSLSLLSTKCSLNPISNSPTYSANAGGRVLSRTSSFFSASTSTSRRVPAPVTITPANAAAIGLPASQLVAAQATAWTLVDARLDWNINTKKINCSSATTTSKLVPVQHSGRGH